MPLHSEGPGEPLRQCQHGEGYVRPERSLFESGLRDVKGERIAWDMASSLLRAEVHGDADPATEARAEAVSGAGAPIGGIPRDEPMLLDVAVQAAILRLLLAGTAPGTPPGAGLAHWLLGFEANTNGGREAALQDPDAAGARTSCLHVVLDALRVSPRRRPLFARRQRRACALVLVLL